MPVSILEAWARWVEKPANTHPRMIRKTGFDLVAAEPQSMSSGVHGPRIKPGVTASGVRRDNWRVRGAKLMLHLIQNE